MKRIYWLIGTMLCFVSGFTTLAAAAAFQADVVESREIEVRTGKIWVKDNIYRLDMEQPGGPELYIIVGARPNTTQVVFPQYKAYAELPSDDLMSQMNDPFQAAEGSAKQYEVKSEGKETIEGLDCDRQLIHHQGSGIMRRWLAAELGFPIKIEQLARDDYYVLLKNIEPTGVAETQFQIPAGYSLKTSEEIRQLTEADPSIAAKNAAYKKSRPSKYELRVMLNEGDSWNLVAVPGTKIRVKVKPSGNTDSVSWFAVPYKGQRQLQSEEQCIYPGEKDIKIDPGSGADGISIGAVRGRLFVTVALVGQKPHVRAIRQVSYKSEREGSTWGVHTPYTSYKVRIYALSSPEAGVRFAAAGKTHQLKIADGQYRDFVFGPQDKLDNLDVMVDYGKIKVVSLLDHRSQADPHILLDMATSETIRGAATTAAPPRAVTADAAATPISAQSPPVAAGPSSPANKDNDRMVLVLDASGSMWGQIDGKAKIEIAKEVLTDLINDLPNQSRAGLVAYGHRSKGDCQDVEELVPLQLVDKKLLIDKIKNINPKGKTPITLSIQKTAEKLKAVEKETVIILVSDGKETCEGDPCALVKELKAAGVRFVMYVIGFDVTEEEKEQLECMAKAGGGQYFTAKTAQEFRVATKEVVKESQNFGYLKINALRSGKPITARVDVFPQGEKQVLTSTRTVTEPTWPGTKMKPGTYDLKILDDGVKPAQSVTFSGVTVTAGSTAEKTADFSGGSLSVEVLANGEKETASLYIYPAGQDQALATGDTSRDNPEIFPLAPGMYDLKVVYKKSSPPTERRFKGIEITAGQAVEKQVEFGEGRLIIEVLVNGSKGSAGLAVFEAGTDKRISTGDTSRDNPKIFTLNPGRYDLQVVYKKSKPPTERRFQNIEIKAGQTVEAKAEFGEGRLSIEVLVNGNKGSAGFYIFEAGTDKRISTGDTSRDNPKIIHLNAGNYDLKVVYRKAIPEKEIILDNIQIAQGQTTEKQVEYQEGILDLQVRSGGKLTKGGLNFFRPGESKRFATGNAGKPINMQPGQYEVEVKAYELEGKPEKRVPFAIRKGQTTALEVAF